MSTTTIERRSLPTARRAAGRAVLAAPLKAGKRLMAWISDERRIRRGIRELRALDDRLLADIGLSHGGIEHAARYGRRAEPWDATLWHWVGKP